MSTLRILRTLRNIVRQRAGIDPPHGVSLRADFRRLTPTFRPQVIFDVGANRGQSAQIFAADFPRARIYCFEPVRNTFLELERNTGSLPQVERHNIALGARTGRALMAAGRKSELSHIVDSAPSVTYGAALEEVAIETLDEFCNSHNISRIGFLKIDTEGHDMAVLEGAHSLLEASRIDSVQVEAGIGPYNTTHIPLGDFRAYLEARSYFLFGFYEQTHEWISKRPNLRRVNAVFISQRIVDESVTA